MICQWIVLLGKLTMAAASPAAASPNDLEALRTWLVAAADGDVAALQSRTAAPFNYRTTNRIKKCEGKVEKVEELGKWLSCFRKNENLILQEIRAGVEVHLASQGDAEPKPLRRLAKKLSGKGRWIHAYFNGDGITSTILFRLSDVDGQTALSALVLDLDFDGG